MGATWEIQKKVIKGQMILLMINCGLALMLIPSPRPFIIGLVFGTLISLLTFRLLALTVEKSVRMAPARAKRYATSQYITRWIIKGVVIYVSIQAEHIHELGTILGLLSIQPVLYRVGLFNDKQFFMRLLKKERRKD